MAKNHLKNWNSEGKGWYTRRCKDGTYLIYNDSWGGNANFTHFHVGADKVQHLFGKIDEFGKTLNKNVSAVYRPLNEFLNRLLKDLIKQKKILEEK